MTSNHDDSLPGCIQLRGLRCVGRHGETAGGAAHTFLLVVDLAIAIDFRALAISDAYADTVDIAELAATVREVVSGQPRLLLETVAVQAARRVLDRYALVSRIHLRLAKPEPPGLDAAEEAVEISLDRFVIR